MNDAELIEGCKAGKREALETIYRLFSRQMYGVCCRYVGEESALDVMHDGFIKVFSAIDQLHATDLHVFFQIIYRKEKAGFLFTEMIWKKTCSLWTKKI